MTIGVKWNSACEEARGEIIMHWDDDEADALHYLELDEEGISETKSLPFGETLSHEEAVDLIRGLTN